MFFVLFLHRYLQLKMLAQIAFAFAMNAVHSVFQRRSLFKASPYKFVPLKMSSSDDEVKWIGVRSCSEVGIASNYVA